MTTQPKSRYEALGISSSKSEVHAAIKDLEKGLFPGAFCTILPDVLDNDPRKCLVQHSDGAGTIIALAYLYSLTSGMTSAWHTPVQNSLVMNLDDMACVGAMGPFVFSQTVDRNTFRIPGEVLAKIIRGNKEFCDQMTELGFPCIVSGGETADVPDLVRTVVINNTGTTKMLRREVIDASRIKPPAYIVGFSSTGQAIWEDRPNSGIGSNGLTLARHETLSSEYRTHTETYAPETDPGLIYSGQFKLEDQLPGDPQFTIATALLSPTRTYLPLIRRLINEIGISHILGLIHNSGGGQIKIGKFGQPGNRYVKSNMLPIPPLFQMLQVVCDLPWKQMYSTYNMGHRLEAVFSTEYFALEAIKIAEECGIHAQIIGTVEKNDDPTKRQVLIKSPHGKFTYDF